MFPNCHKSNLIQLLLRELTVNMHTYTLKYGPRMKFKLPLKRGLFMKFVDNI